MVTHESAGGWHRPVAYQGRLLWRACMVAHGGLTGRCRCGWSRWRPATHDLADCALIPKWLPMDILTLPLNVYRWIATGRHSWLQVDINVYR